MKIPRLLLWNLRTLSLVRNNGKKSIESTAPSVVIGYSSGLLVLLRVNPWDTSQYVIPVDSMTGDM